MQQGQTKRYRNFFHTIAHNTGMLFVFCALDVRTRLIGSWLWVGVNQVLPVIVYYSVFGMMLNLEALIHTPYLPWLLCGMGPWFCYHFALTGALSVLHDYAPLVRTGSCSAGFLPLVRVASAVLVHALWSAAALAAAWAFGVLRSSAWSVPYYLLCSAFNAVAQAYCAAAFAPFFRAVPEGMEAGLMISFWFTPVVWPASLIQSELALTLTRLNPLYYIVEGMRNCILYDMPILPWNNTLWFFMATFALCIVGAICFARMERQYREVL